AVDPVDAVGPAPAPRRQPPERRVEQQVGDGSKAGRARLPAPGAVAETAAGNAGPGARLEGTDERRDGPGEHAGIRIEEHERLAARGLGAQVGRAGKAEIVARL